LDLRAMRRIYAHSLILLEVKTMFVVYWLEGPFDTNGYARFERFEADALAQALAFAESLRKRRADGDEVRFVTLCSENPQSVGKPGAAEPRADYDWKKRRS
jgi:hypothetical protein